jgi:3-hydroxyacyl-CoA dehydrogenase
MFADATGEGDHIHPLQAGGHGADSLQQAMPKHRNRQCRPRVCGLTCIARRAAEKAAQASAQDLLPGLKDAFQAAAMAKVGTSALECRKLGYLLESDVVVAHKDELLFVAINEARAMAAQGYRAPHRRSFPVAGRSGIATIRAQLVNMRDGGFISAHDFHIGLLIAEVVCGGQLDAGTLVTEEYLMALERKAFCSLLTHPKTQERIMGMMSTGKPVRN